MPPTLPLLEGDRPERADAAENRRRVLAAAARLFAEQGAANVSMEAAAAPAPGGQGTLFGSHAARLAGRPYAFYRTHVTLLLREAGCGDRAEYLADVLLSPLAASTFRYHRELRALAFDEVV